MGYILALDQGSTKTAALVADETGRILGTGTARGACHASTGMDVAMGAVLAAAAAAMGQAGITTDEVRCVSAGLSGADWPYEYPMLTAAVRRTLAVEDVRVVNDCIVARRAGTDAPYGSVLCAGTGLNVAVTSPCGESFIFGYYIQGDDQGGDALGRLALRAVFAAESGLGPATALKGRMLARFHLPTVDELLCLYGGGGLGPTSTLIPVVVDAVRAGDPVTVQLVTDFGARLARYVVAGLKRFDMTGLEQDVVLSGGIFKADLPPLRAAVTAAIADAAPQARLVDARYEPVVGAMLLALDRSRWSKVAVEESASDHQLIRMCSQ